MRATDVAQFERLGVPVVLLDGWFPSKRNDSVVIDNQRGAWQATQYLISQGHRDVGYLNSNVDIRNFLERRDGYLSAMRSLGQKDFDPAKAIVRVGTTIESAFDDMSAYLATGPDLPTAFFPSASSSIPRSPPWPSPRRAWGRSPCSVSSRSSRERRRESRSASACCPS